MRKIVITIIAWVCGSLIIAGAVPVGHLVGWCWAPLVATAGLLVVAVGGWRTMVVTGLGGLTYIFPPSDWSKPKEG